MSTAQAAMRVASLAEEVGISADTVRYYERIGLLMAGSRTPTNHRRYDAAAVDRLRFIQGGQRLGLRLAEIRELLDLRDSGESVRVSGDPAPSPVGRDRPGDRQADPAAL
jgi:DNA-binding transcriptional MerR regulator